MGRELSRGGTPAQEGARKGRFGSSKGTMTSQAQPGVDPLVRSRIEGIGRPRVEPSFKPEVIDRMIQAGGSREGIHRGWDRETVSARGRDRGVSAWKPAVSCFFGRRCPGSTSTEVEEMPRNEALGVRDTTGIPHWHNEGSRSLGLLNVGFSPLTLAGPR